MKLNPLVMMREGRDGDGVVFDPQNNKVMSLNPVSVLIWHGLENGESKLAIVDSILAQFEVDRATCEKDVAVFLDKLVQRGLLVMD